MILLVEGVDKAGKTPLIKLLCESGKDLGHSTVPMRVKQPPKTLAEPLKVMFDEIYQVWPQSAGKLLIYDRFPVPSEMVYRPIVTKELDPKWHLMLAGWIKIATFFFQMYDVRIVYLDPPGHRERVNAEPDPYITPDMFDGLKSRYEIVLELLERQGIPVFNVHDTWFDREVADRILFEVTVEKERSYASAHSRVDASNLLPNRIRIPRRRREDSRPSGVV